MGLAGAYIIMCLNANKTHVSCNTSTGQLFVVQTQYQVLDPSIFRRNTLLTLNPVLAFYVNSIADIQEGIREVTCQNTSVTSFSYEYREIGGTNPNGTFESIAYGNWTMLLVTDNMQYYQFDATGAEDEIPVFSDETGMGMNALNAIAGLFEVMYWLYMADFGQTSPTLYPLFNYGDTLQPLPSDFAEIQQIPPTYNVFVNSSQYGLLSNWIETFLSIVGGTNETTPPPFETGLPLSPSETVFIISYSCQQRVLKPPLSLIFTVIAADYPLILGGYQIIKWIALRIEKRISVDLQL